MVASNEMLATAEEERAPPLSCMGLESMFCSALCTRYVAACARVGDPACTSIRS